MKTRAKTGNLTSKRIIMANLICITLELGANTHFLVQFGTVKKHPIVSKKNPVKFYENGITIIPTPVQGKNGNCQKLLDLRRHKSQIGSKIEDREIERQKERGKSNFNILIVRPCHLIENNGLYFICHYRLCRGQETPRYNDPIP